MLGVILIIVLILQADTIKKAKEKNANLIEKNKKLRAEVKQLEKQLYGRPL